MSPSHAITNPLYTIIASPTKAPISYTNRTTFVWNTKGEVIAAAAVLPFLGIVLVTLRFYNRLKHKAGIGADDWLIVPATVSSYIPQYRDHFCNHTDLDGADKMIVTGMGVTLLVRLYHPVKILYANNYGRD